MLLLLLWDFPSTNSPPFFIPPSFCLIRFFFSVVVAVVCYCCLCVGKIWFLFPVKLIRKMCGNKKKKKTFSVRSPESDGKISKKKERRKKIEARVGNICGWCGSCMEWEMVFFISVFPSLFLARYSCCCCCYYCCTLFVAPLLFFIIIPPVANDIVIKHEIVQSNYEPKKCKKSTTL